MSLPPTPDLWHLRPHTTQDIELTHMSQVHERSEASVVGRVTSTLQQEHPLDWEALRKSRANANPNDRSALPRLFRVFISISYLRGFDSVPFRSSTDPDRGPPSTVARHARHTSESRAVSRVTTLSARLPTRASATTPRIVVQHGCSLRQRWISERDDPVARESVR